MGFFRKQRPTTAGRPSGNPFGLRPVHPVRLVYGTEDSAAVDLGELARYDSNMFKKVQATQVSFKKPNRKTNQPRALRGLRARVRVYIDFSDSMEWEGRKYYSRPRPVSIMQAIVERLLSVGLLTDIPDGVIEIIPFHSHLLPEIKVGLRAKPENGVVTYHDVINKYVWGHHTMGGTNYVPVLQDIREKALEGDELLIAGIVTDGDPNDGDEAEEALIRLSEVAALTKWFGINDVRYLRRLDNLERFRPGARLFDNADTKIFGTDGLPSIFDVTDEEFAEAFADELDTSITGALAARVLLSA